jgi:hypothetical protein
VVRQRTVHLRLSSQTCFPIKNIDERESAIKKRASREKGVNTSENSEKKDGCVKKSETRDDVVIGEAP